MSRSRNSSRTLPRPARRVTRPAALLRRRTEDAPAPAPEPDAQAAAPSPLQQRIRDAGGPEDHALYTCACGFAFEADVSAAVACPHCGAEQTW